MDGGGNQFLASSGLAEDKDRCVDRSNLLGPIKNILHAIALPDDLVEMFIFAKFLPEKYILDHKAVFQCLDLLQCLAKGFLCLPMFLDLHLQLIGCHS